MAIARKKKVSTLPDWPAIRICYSDPGRMDLGVQKIRDGENSFYIEK